jgi:hypothetical protein
VKLNKMENNTPREIELVDLIIDSERKIIS